MRHATRTGRRLVALALLAGLIAAAWLAGAPGGAVDWRAARVVVIESDDWGLCGFLPAAGTLAADERAALAAEVSPTEYWDTTLEDSVAVGELARLLGRCRGRDGLPAVLQANVIVSALAPPPGPGPWAQGVPWLRYDAPDLPPSYARPGLRAAVDSAIARGVWRPELHGSFHYDPAARRAVLAADPAALDAARRGVLPFRGSAKAWEWGPQRATEVLSEELARAVAVFEDRFGRPPASICAPDYVWDARGERLWAAHGLKVIQAKREQRSPRWATGALHHRALKVLARGWDRLAHGDRVYLDRNVRFEPAQAPGDTALVARALRDVAAAWARGEPAVVESHRLNYVRLTPAAAAAGRRQLERFLTGLTAAAGGAPIFVTDDELAQLRRGGVSCGRRGDRLVLRNLSRATRLVHAPAGAVAGGRGDAAGGAPGPMARACFVPPGRTVVLPLGDPPQASGAPPEEAGPGPAR